MVTWDFCVSRQPKTARRWKRRCGASICWTHNLGSVPEFCDRTILVKQTVLAHGLTEEIFTRANLEMAFGGVLRHFTLGGADLHDDDDAREVNIITDDERPFVMYGERAKGGKDT